MRDLLGKYKKSRLNYIFSSSVAAWMGAAVVYFAISVLFMGTVVTECSTTIFGYPGDGSGGVGWFQWADGGAPFWKYTYLSNYPFGEELNRPQFITAYALLVPFSILSQFVGPVCGLNLMVLLAFLSTALVMFGLVQWLTKKNSIALFAGFAAAFVPYHFLQAQGHFTYAYSAIFIAIIWAFLWFYEKPTVKRATLLVSLYILSFYMDGYFILLSTGLISVLFLVFILQGVIKTRKAQGHWWMRLDLRRIWMTVRQNKTSLLVAVIVSGVLIAPIIYNQVVQGDKIQSELSQVRSNIESETTTYGTYGSDFLLPSVTNIFVNSDYIEWRTDNIHDSNIAESTLYIGYTLIILMAFLLGYIVTKRGRADSYAKQYKFVLIVSVLIIVILTLFSLPPKITIVGIEVPTPTSILIEVTDKWRVISRFFMITHAAMVLIAAIALAILMNRLLKWRWLIFSIVSLLLFIEYVPAHGFNWSFMRDTPSVYREMANDESVKVIAEYPIVDHPSATLPFTFTFQQVHGKPIFNANSSITNQGALRRSIAGLEDRQTLCILRALGIDTVTTLNIDAGSVKGLTTYREAVSDVSIGKIYSYRITPGEECKYALVARDGFTVTYDKTDLKSSLDMINSAILTIDPVGKNTLKDGQSYAVHFNAKAFDGGAQRLRVKQGEKELWSGVIQENTEVAFTVDSKQPLFLTVPGYYNTPALSIFDMSVESK